MGLQPAERPPPTGDPGANGTFANQADNWAGLAPTLANAGFCVYSLTYGDQYGFVGGTGPVMRSAEQLSRFAETVRARSGSDQVDLVGHSQGGLLAEYYTKFLGGRANVHTVVALSPTTHGTTVDNLASVAETFHLTPALASICQAAVDQLPGSPVIRALNTGRITAPGVAYTVIETRYEYVVTPAPEAAFIDEPGVTNLTVQDRCPADLSDHIGLAYSPTAWQLTIEALNARQ